MAVAEIAVREIKLGVHVVQLGLHAHRIDQITPGGKLDVGAFLLLVEAREDACEVCDGLVAVSGDVRTLGILLSGAIRIQLPKANREELHDLPSVVLIRIEPLEVVGRIPPVTTVLVTRPLDGESQC